VRKAKKISAGITALKERPVRYFCGISPISPGNRIENHPA
jgi:hypothetical protein